MFAVKSLAARHDLLMYICCALAFVGVASHGVGFVFGLLFMVAWSASWVMFQTGKHRLISLKIWNVVILLSVAFTAAMMYFSEESVISSGIRFILMLIAIKLLSRRGGERDDWQIYALTFLLMAAGTAVNEDLIYGFVFALYVLFGTFGLALLHLRTEQDRTGVGASSAMNKSYGRILIVLAGMVFASSIAIFFTFPRVGLGFFAQKTRASMAMTGFSDQVELGSHGVIRTNPEVVMRVQFADGVMPPDAESYHWRMMSFDHYDGVQWRRQHPVIPKAFIRARDQSEIYSATPLYTAPLREQLSSHTKKLDIYMEPLAVKQIPQLWPMKSIGLPETIKIPFNPNSVWIKHDPFYHDVYMEQRNEVGVAFQLEVSPPPPRQPLSQASYEPMEELRYEAFLQLPVGMERLDAFTQELTQDIDTPYEKARFIENHLQTSYTYTTDLPPVEGDNPVEFFLFTSKQGHCEFFATTMTLMLRAEGIPARLVNGFLGGIWNPAGNYMAVRQGDAHSWVEVYLPEYGWVPFDPTPSAGTQPNKPNPLVQRVRDIYDAARMRWMQWVIEYNLDAQIAGLRRLSSLLSPNTKTLEGGSQDAKKSADGEGFKLDLSLRSIIIWLVMAVIAGLGSVNVRTVRSKDQLSLRALDEHLFGWLAVGIVLMIWAGLGGAWMGLMHQWDGLYIALGVTLPGLAMLIALWLRLRRHAASHDRLKHLFVRVEKSVHRHQITRQPDEGPQHFLTRLIAHYPSHGDAIASFTRHYLRARFSGASQASAADLEALDAMAKTLSKALKATTPEPPNN